MDMLINDRREMNDELFFFVICSSCQLEESSDHHSGGRELDTGAKTYGGVGDLDRASGGGTGRLNRDGGRADSGGNSHGADGGLRLLGVGGDRLRGLGLGGGVGLGLNRGGGFRGRSRRGLSLDRGGGLRDRSRSGLGLNRRLRSRAGMVVGGEAVGDLAGDGADRGGDSYSFGCGVRLGRAVGNLRSTVSNGADCGGVDS